jgi:hypothetical protein
MFQDLQNWRSNLDTQVTKYKVVSIFALHINAICCILIIYTCLLYY